MLNIIVEFLQPRWGNYYNPNISASHNGLRLSVQDYGALKMNRIMKRHGANYKILATIESTVITLASNSIASQTSDV